MGVSATCLTQCDNVSQLMTDNVMTESFALLVTHWGQYNTVVSSGLNVDSLGLGLHGLGAARIFFRISKLIDVL